MLQIIFGDDEHTAADGPYSRVLKTRKWLYLSSAVSLAINHGLFNERATNEAIIFFTIPEQRLSLFLFLGIIYLLAQYFLLLVQLYSTYE